jgi:hypothetical protein
MRFVLSDGHRRQHRASLLSAMARLLARSATSIPWPWSHSYSPAGLFISSWALAQGTFLSQLILEALGTCWGLSGGPSSPPLCRHQYGFGCTKQSQPEDFALSAFGLSCPPSGLGLWASAIGRLSPYSESSASSTTHWHWEGPNSRASLASGCRFATLWFQLQGLNSMDGGRVHQCPSGLVLR